MANQLVQGAQAQLSQTSAHLCWWGEDKSKSKDIRISDNRMLLWHSHKGHRAAPRLYMFGPTTLYVQPICFPVLWLCHCFWG